VRGLGEFEIFTKEHLSCSANRSFLSARPRESGDPDGTRAYLTDPDSRLRGNERKLSRQCERNRLQEALCDPGFPRYIEPRLSDRGNAMKTAVITFAALAVTSVAAYAAYCLFC